ncbi:MAG: biotin/lipoyl-binding protein [Clostridiales bacterium]|nr:biotin/lipoyl-binding protein [Clostridiales bacterium]
MKYLVELNGKKYEIEVEKSEATLLSVTDAPVAAAPVAAAPVAAAPVAAAPVAAAPVAAAPVAGGETVKSPMPGNILEVKVSAGQSVKAGDVILVLEAMKMENEIVAPCAGTIKQITVSKGSTVKTDEVLAVVG